MRIRLLVLTLAACGSPETPPVEPASPPEAAAPNTPPATSAPAASDEIPPVPEGSSGQPSLSLSAKRVRPGESVKITFFLPGPNGCYRQSPVETTVGDHELVHSYTTSFEGDMCTQALVPGGFRYEFTPPEPGEWTGRVIVDGKQVLTYIIESGA